MIRIAAAVFGASFLVLMIVAIVACGGGSSPSVIAPWPMLVAIPMYMTGSLVGPPVVVGLVLATVVTAAWRWPRPMGPLVVIAGILIIVGSWLWLWVGWEYGVRFNGQPYALTMLAMHLIATATIATLATRMVRKQTRLRVTLTTVTLAFWLVWGAFPWLGDI